MVLLISHGVPLARGFIIIIIYEYYDRSEIDLKVLELSIVFFLDFF